MLRLIIRRFSFGLVVSLSPTYYFFWGFLETVKGGLDSIFVSGSDIFLVVMNFLSTFKTESSHSLLFGFVG